MNHAPQKDQRPVAMLLVLAFLGGAVPGVAQTLPIGVRGEVLDSVTRVAVPDVRILLAASRMVAATDETGAFQLAAVPGGTHTMIVGKPGYRTRVYRFAVGEEHAGHVDMGVLLLNPGQDPISALEGVVESNIGHPVPRATVALNGHALAVTDQDGAFRVEVPNIGLNLLEIRRIGFIPHATDLELHGDAQVTVTLNPLPVELEPILVEGERMVFATGRLREFYERRATGLGKYFTRQEIEEANLFSVTDLFRRMPSIRLMPGAFGRRVVTMRRESCAPQIYVDGMQLLDFDIDDFLHPDDVQGIEVYPSGMTAPPEFTNGKCGAIVIWTR